MMCKFCEGILDEDKEVTWSMRSTMADDNICEFVNGNNCDSCHGDCMMYFELYGYKSNNGAYVGVSYRQEMRDVNREKVIISPFSETIQFNYCPFCGEQMSEDLREIDKYYDHQICVYDKDKIY